MDRKSTLGNGSRKSTRRGTRETRFTEALEPRRLFTSVPVVGPFVLNAEFHAENAPHELRVQFNEYVWDSLEGSDLVLINTLGRYVIPSEIMTVNWDFDTNTASFVFVRLGDQGVLPEGNWHATLLSEGITNAEGQPLDGDGDHLPGGNFEFDFSFIRGDANQDGQVDMTDFNIMGANFGQTNRNFAQGDFNYDNIVDLRDANLFAGRFGMSASSFAGSSASSTFSTTEIGSADLGGDETLLA